MQDPILNIAVEAARSAGNLMLRSALRLNTIKISEKKPNDYVTEIDHRVEQDIISHIQKAYPTHGIIAEEGGNITGDDYTWIIDPIDGTRNFIHGFPHYAVSIAVMHKNKLAYGVIYDPNRDELFTATRGKGAKLNNHRIRVGERKQLEQCLLSTGFSYRHTDPDSDLPTTLFETMMAACGDVRRVGAASLDLAYVACGRLDGFFEMGLKIWDVAAGVLLIKEAGGMVSDVLGGEDYLKNCHIVTANNFIIRQILKQIRPHVSALSL